MNDEFYREELEHPDIVRMMRDGQLEAARFGEGEDGEDDWDYTYEDVFL